MSDSSERTPSVKATTLYRLFDEADVLLYVGIAVDPGRRFAKHREDKAWWSQVANINLTTYPSRDEAQEAERQAIKTEKPRHNVRHNGVPPHLAQAAPVYVCAECGERITDEEDGYLQVDHRAVARHRQAGPVPSRPLGSGFKVVDLSALLDPNRPREAEWHAVHVDCDVVGDYAYWYDLNRVRTWPAFVRFVAHVIEKSWVTKHTNIDNLLYAVAPMPADNARRQLTGRRS